MVLTLQSNLVVLTSLTVNGVPGRFILGSANARTALDPRFLARLPAAATHSLELNARQSLSFTPVTVDLHGIADGILGADLWKSVAITVDYRSGLLTLQREGIHPELMTLTRFDAEPEVDLTVDGAPLRAVVDTASPEAIELPGTTVSRRNARVTVGGTTFPAVEVRDAAVTRPRIGNRLLSKFLMTIDYGRKQVGLWRDPRIR